MLIKVTMYMYHKIRFHKIHIDTKKPPLCRRHTLLYVQRPAAGPPMVVMWFCCLHQLFKKYFPLENYTNMASIFTQFEISML